MDNLSLSTDNSSAINNKKTFKIYQYQHALNGEDTS